MCVMRVSQTIALAGWRRRRAGSLGGGSLGGGGIGGGSIGGGRRRPGSRRSGCCDVIRVLELNAAVELVRRFGRQQQFVLAMPFGNQPAAVDAMRDQILPCRLGAAFRQRLIIFGGAHSVGMPADDYVKLAN